MYSVGRGGEGSLILLSATGASKCKEVHFQRFCLSFTRNFDNMISKLWTQFRVELYALVMGSNYADLVMNE
jgi:hypothetical protein